MVTDQKTKSLITSPLSTKINDNLEACPSHQISHTVKHAANEDILRFIIHMYEQSTLANLHIAN